MPATEASSASALLDAVGVAHPACTTGARIVCLVPSISELLIHLGLEHELVGRTGFCVHPRAAMRRIPKLGGTKDVQVERLRALAPTHVIVNIDENRRETVEQIARFVPHVVVTHPCAPSDNFGLYRLLGHIFGRTAQAEALCAELSAALEAATAVRLRLPPQRVLYLIWRDPWMSVSPATYIAATLASVGWLSWPAAEEPRYPRIALADAARAGVERVLLSSEPYRFRALHKREVELACGLPTQLIDGSLCSWYGSRAPAGLRYLAARRQELATPGEPA